MNTYSTHSEPNKSSNITMCKDSFFFFHCVKRITGKEIMKWWEGLLTMEEGDVHFVTDSISVEFISSVVEAILQPLFSKLYP